eukprot:353393-Chlamydomonas_euryale.AAC.11
MRGARLALFSLCACARQRQACAAVREGLLNLDKRGCSVDRVQNSQPHRTSPPPHHCAVEWRLHARSGGVLGGPEGRCGRPGVRQPSAAAAEGEYSPKVVDSLEVLDSMEIWKAWRVAQPKVRMAERMNSQPGGSTTYKLTYKAGACRLQRKAAGRLQSEAGA